MTTVPKAISGSSFAILAQRSEQARIILFVGVLGLLVVMSAVRRWTGGLVMTSDVYWWTLGLLAAGLLYELRTLRIVVRANAKGRVIGETCWRVNAVVETFIAVGMLVINHLLSPRGEVAALSAPALLVLPLVAMLSILRLRPLFTLWTGLAGAGAHATLAVRAYIVTQAELSTLPVYLSYAILLAMIGAAGALVAGRVRGYVEAAARESEALAVAREEIVRVERDLSMARDIQRGLLPQFTPSIPGFDIAGMSRAADQTGGDYYDWQELPDGRLAIVLADVSGHGIAPALVMAVCRAYARASLPLMQNPSSLLDRINTLVHDDVRGGRFVTLALAVLDGASSRIELVSAGHGPGLLLRAGTGVVEQFGGDGVPLGILPDEKYGQPRMLEMAKGDALLMLTDGFFEWQRARDGQQFGIERLTQVLQHAAGEDSETILRRIDEAVQAFAEGSLQSDDVTAVIIKRVDASE